MLPGTFRPRDVFFFVERPLPPTPSFENAPGRFFSRKNIGRPPPGHSRGILQHKAIPETVLVVEVEERFLFFQALSRHARLANLVGALHARDRGRHFSTDDAWLGFLGSRIVRVALFLRKLGLCEVCGHKAVSVITTRRPHEQLVPFTCSQFSPRAQNSPKILQKQKSKNNAARATKIMYVESRAPYPGIAFLRKL